MTATESTDAHVTRIVAFLGDPGLHPTTYICAGNISERSSKLPWQAWRQLANAPAEAELSLVGICSNKFCNDWRYHLADDADQAGLGPGSINSALMQYRTDDATGSEESVWGLFEMIRHALSAGDLSQRDDYRHLTGEPRRLDEKPTRVIVDITHGFRALPFLAAAVLAFLSAANRRAKHRIDYRICYAAADDVAFGQPVPIWDLSRSLQLIELGDAVHAFMRHGRADDIAEFFEQSSNSGAKNLAPLMREFADDSLLMRLPAILKTSASELNAGFDAQLADVIRAYPPVKQDLEELHARIGELIGTADRDAAMTKAGLQATLALAERLFETGRYAELYNLLRESLITAFGVVALINPETSPQPGTPDSRVFRAGLEQDCGTVGTSSKGAVSIKKRKALYREPFPALAVNIAKTFSEVAERRNDVAHCSTSARAAPSKELLQDLEDSLRQFRVFVQQITNAG